MNDPIDRDGGIEPRLEKLEKDLSSLLKMAQGHNLDINQIKSMLGHIQFDTGTARESLDTIERKQTEVLRLLRDIAKIQPDHSEHLDTLVRGQQEIKRDIEAIYDVFVKDFERVGNSIGEVNATLSERFDTLERTIATKDDIASIKATQDQILQLLQQRSGE